jgi:hypothetical protein
VLFRSRILICPFNTGGHSVFGKGIGEGESVLVGKMCLASLFRKYRISRVDFLKMDCEGAEYDVLMACPKSALSKISRISMEFHNLDARRNGPALAAFLEKAGFEVGITQVSKDVGHTGYIYAKRVSQ